MSKAPGQPIKDPERERPVPLIWRPVLREVVDAIQRGDPALASDVNGVEPVHPETVAQIREYIADYGEALAAIPDATWETSVALWIDGYWDVLIDLWTKGEGRSDLVLHVRVFECDGSYYFEICHLSVP